MGATASAPIKKQAKALKGRRYMRGMRPEKYFEVVVKPELGELFEILGFSDDEAFEIYVQFIAIDDDNSGEVSVSEFHGHLNAQPTKFSERVFAILDIDMSGVLDLREFVVGVWNYCTYDNTLMAKLLFDIFDVDRRGKITMPELDAMLRMLYASEDADPKLLMLLGVNGSSDENALTFQEFLAAVEENRHIAQPAFDLQQAIRRKVLGIKYWEKKAKKRTEMFANYDQADLTSVQAVEAIVTAKQKERQAEAERIRRETAAKHDEELQLAAEEHRALHEGNKARKMNKLIELRETRAPEEVEEERAWQDLKDVREVASADFVEARVDDLRAARESLWDCYERAVATSRAWAKIKADKEHELASKDDAASKAEAWVSTKQGSAKYEFLCLQAYGNMLHDEYVKRGPPMKAFAALHARGDAPVTLATSIAYRHPRLELLKVAKETAMQNLVARFAKQETAAAADRAAREAAQQQADFDALHVQLVAEVGHRGTAWDLVWDADKDRAFYLHVEDDGQLRRHDKNTAICDNCDEMIPPEDPICPQCQAKRSAKNQRLYTGFKV